MKLILLFTSLATAIPICATENNMHGVIDGVESKGVTVYLRAVDGRDIPGVGKVYHAKTSSFLKIGTRHITFLCVTSGEPETIDNLGHPKHRRTVSYLRGVLLYLNKSCLLEL